MFNSLIIFAAQYLPFFAFATVGIFFIVQPWQIKKRLVISGAVIGALAYLFSRIASYLYYNPRPFVSEHVTPLLSHVADNGFPSDHTLLASVLAAIVYGYNKKLGIVLWGMALLIGITRVMAGVHHAIDIIASVGIVLISVAIHMLIDRYLKLVVK